ncbi:hypothetical protein ACNFBR_15635 [Pseudomonas sp. NY11955]|uniref:hypothetical protein n=1 Tax=Pseudomonas sp. NY11955 TaxID=3400363 RepID=UPI003A8B9852
MSTGTGKRYPIEVMGKTFSQSAEFHDWIDSLHDKQMLNTQEHAAVQHTYDSGFLAHWDYKQLMKKPVQP